MNPIILYAIQLAGALHLFVACANFALPKILSYRENLAKVTPIIREIFFVHALYIVLVLVGIGLLCLFFPGDLAGSSRLGRFLSGFLAIFWSLRVVIQFCFYDRTIKLDHPFGNVLFSTIFLYFAVVFVAATFLAK
jgi:hypothetical protein